MMYNFDKNVFSVGCSFTAGTGVARENNYTSELANLLKFNPQNHAASGHSNQYIFRKVIQLLKDWNNDDVLIIQWTSPTRDEIITKEGYLFTSPFHEWTSLEFLYGPDPYPSLSKMGVDKDELEKNIISKYQNKVIDYSIDFFRKDYQLNLTFCFQFALFGLLEKLGVKYIMFDGWEFENGWEFNKEKYTDKDLIRKYTNEKYLNTSFAVYTNTPGNEHPNTEGHKMWADYLYKKIIELNYYPKENKLI